MTLAYLLFRVADTLEDAENSSRAKKLASLATLREVLTGSDKRQIVAVAEEWAQPGLTSHRGYLTLLREFPSLMTAIADLGAPVRSVILHHACRTVDGMLDFVERSEADGTLRLKTLRDLRDYCFVVAGIVGELITELLVVPRHRSDSAELWRLAAIFGEGLQLVNILRDSEDDADHGRIYLPTQVPIQDVFALARDDLDRAVCYVDELRRRRLGQGIIPFAEFPRRLAQATLSRVELQGAGAKLDRSEVAKLLLDVDERFRSPRELPSDLGAHLLRDL
jgi:farnesyl-diphosphate farnesyltransferase